MKRKITQAFLGITMICLIATTVLAEEAFEVRFPDPNLEALIRETIDKPEGPITNTDLQGITELDSGHGQNTPDEEKIERLTGLKYCTNLRELWLYILD